MKLLTGFKFVQYPDEENHSLICFKSDVTLLSLKFSAGIPLADTVIYASEASCPKSLLGECSVVKLAFMEGVLRIVPL